MHAAKENEFTIAPLSALEISGAVSARVIHDLSNLISGIIGNAEYAGQALDNSVGLQKALQAICTSANAAGKLVGQCLPLQHSVSNQTFPFDAAELAEIIAQAASIAPGWRATVPAGLTGQAKVHPRWLASAIWQLALETQADRGEIHFASGLPVFPVAWQGASPNNGRPLHLFQTTLSYRAEDPLVSDEAPVTPERPGLLATVEIIRRFKGQLQFLSNPPGRQEITFLIPLL
jgi:hypothetical protein